MSSEQVPSQRPEKARIERKILITAIVVVIGVPTVAVLLHLLWPTIVWLRALACGLVVVPGELLLTGLMVRVTEDKGSIVSCWTILLPFIAGFSSVNHGWAAPLWTLGVFSGLHLAGFLYWWIIKASK